LLIRVGVPRRLGSQRFWEGKKADYFYHSLRQSDSYH